MKLEYKLLKTDKNTNARLGQITYNGKVYETPMKPIVSTFI